LCREADGKSTSNEPVGKGEAMRKVAVIAMVVVAGVVLAASVMAQSAVKEECVALCDQPPVIGPPVS